MTDKKIIVSVSNDLCIDQRVHRICDTLTEAGYEVLLVGRRLKNSPEISERQYKFKRVKLLFNNGLLFYLCLNCRLFFLLMFSKADIFLSNDLDTLLANTFAARLKRKKLVYDSHELFTEVPELADKKLKKKIWLFVERICIKKANRSYTVCQPIADYYNSLYDINMKVVRNLPVQKHITTDFDKRDNILVYQGAINKDRGVDIMIKAVAAMENCKLYIAGKGNLEDKLKKMTEELDITDRIIFKGVLDFDSLHQLTQTAKIGFSLEQGNSLNYKYALPNKIFDYIQAGVPVICSDLPEMRKIVDNYSIGVAANIKDADELKELIIALLNDKAKLENYNANCIKAAELLNWENEKDKLLEVFADL
ncbi:MAG TPA: glycosyltransferase [Bacteroidales bacterium]|nr:glycosyltransferase [Bacteroidales bacterium]